ncbi:MAG: hypothetical protein WEA34_02545, partial [Gemmatimonadota bacterium]
EDEPAEDEFVLDVTSLAPEPEEDEPEDEAAPDVSALAPEPTDSEPDEPVHVPTDQPEGSSPAGGAPRIYTRTLGELYAKQGFLERAVEVFRQLRSERPHDEDLTARLRELEAQMHGADEAPDPIADTAAREARARERDEQLESLARDLAEYRESQPDIDTPFAWTGDETDSDEGAETGGASDAGPSIGRYFEDLLSWGPSEDRS